MDLLKRYVLMKERLEPVIRIDFCENKIFTLYRPHITNSYPLGDCIHLSTVTVEEYEEILKNIFKGNKL